MRLILPIPTIKKGILNEKAEQCDDRLVYKNKNVNKSSYSSLVSRNIIVSNRRTSVRLEPEMWDALREICRREHKSIHEICTAISIAKPHNTSLTAAIRVFVMSYFRAACTEDGHSKAGHGPGGSFMISFFRPSSAEKDKMINEVTQQKQKIFPISKLWQK